MQDYAIATPRGPVPPARPPPPPHTLEQTLSRISYYQNSFYSPPSTSTTTNTTTAIRSPNERNADEDDDNDDDEDSEASSLLCFRVTSDVNYDDFVASSVFENNHSSVFENNHHHHHSDVEEEVQVEDDRTMTSTPTSPTMMTKVPMKPVGRVLDPAFSIPSGTPADVAREIMTAHVNGLRVLQSRTTSTSSVSPPPSHPPPPTPPSSNRRQSVFHFPSTGASAKRHIDISEPTLVASSSQQRTIPIVRLFEETTTETERGGGGGRRRRRRYSTSSGFAKAGGSSIAEGSSSSSLSLSRRLRKFKEAISKSGNHEDERQQSQVGSKNSSDTTIATTSRKIRRSMSIPTTRTFRRSPSSSFSIRRILPSSRSVPTKLSHPETWTSYNNNSSSSVPPPPLAPPVEDDDNNNDKKKNVSETSSPSVADRKWVVPDRGQESLEADRADVHRLRDMMRDVVDGEKRILKEIARDTPSPLVMKKLTNYDTDEEEEEELLEATHNDTDVSEGEAEVVEILLGTKSIKNESSFHDEEEATKKKEDLSRRDSNSFPQPPFREVPVSVPGDLAKSTGPSSNTTTTTTTTSLSKRLFSFKKSKPSSSTTTQTQVPKIIAGGGGDNDDARRRRTIVYVKNFLPALPTGVTTDNLGTNSPPDPTNEKVILSERDRNSLSRSEKAVTERHIAAFEEKKRLERIESEKILSFLGYGYEHPKVVKSEESERRRNRASQSSSRWSKRSKGGGNEEEVQDTKRHGAVGREQADVQVESSRVEDDEEEEEEEGLDIYYRSNTAGTLSTEMDIEVFKPQDSPNFTTTTITTQHDSNKKESGVFVFRRRFLRLDDDNDDHHHHHHEGKNDHRMVSGSSSDDDVLLSPFGAEPPSSSVRRLLETEAVIFNYCTSESLRSPGLAITTPSGFYEEEEGGNEEEEEGEEVEERVLSSPSVRRLSTLLEVMELKGKSNLEVMELKGKSNTSRSSSGGGRRGEAQRKLEELMRQ